MSDPTLEPAPDDSVEFEAQGLAQPWVEPDYSSDDPQKAPPVWAESQKLREVLERGVAGQKPWKVELQGLRNAVRRQLPSLGLFERLSLLPQAQGQSQGAVAGIWNDIGLYVLVFPGEAKDNTGIKDLNDRVLGYELNSHWMARRQKAVREVFWHHDNVPAPKWITVGQDYKTAYILPVGKSAKDFAADLVTLDTKLKAYLLPILDEAEKKARDPKDQPRLKAIAELRKKLNKKAVYRFPYLYGFSFIPAYSDRTIILTLRLITEALKAAGMARWREKRDDLSQRPVKKLASGAVLPKTRRGEDDRGLTFDNRTFLALYKFADTIKDAIQAGAPSIGVSYNVTYVNQVWLTVILKISRKPYANPDVVRDIRKKAVVEPKINAGLKLAFEATVEFMELWLTTINMIDYVAGFLNREFPDLLTRYHDLGLTILHDLNRPPPDHDIDFRRLTKFLTHDISQKIVRSVLGTSSEFIFYAYASDWTDQVFFSMDIRDLGVELVTHYEVASEIIIDNSLAGTDLMRATFMSGDITVQRKRVTYDMAVTVLRNYYRKLLLGGGLAQSDQAVFKPVPLDAGRVPDFDQSVRVMLGGDEVFVAAHPAYAKYISNIVADMNAATFLDAPLNLRVGVAISSAKRESGQRKPGEPTRAQRRNNQDAHDAAITAASSTHKVLKALERQNRRIELLITKLINNKDKAKLAPDHQSDLDALGLTRLYAQVRQDNQTDPRGKRAAKLRTQIEKLDVRALATSDDFHLFDYNGNEVDLAALTKKANQLEAAVVKDVGRDNIYVEVPLVTQMPKWFKDILKRYHDGKWPFEYKDGKGRDEP